LFDYGAKIGKAKNQAQQQQQEDETEGGGAEQISICDYRDEPGPNALVSSSPVTLLPRRRLKINTS